MDFFEKAHVVRNRDNKQNKDEQTMKKQLKLMLQGYKTSNTDIIKEAENVKLDLDDSTSVSGFSDLNLTVSTIEEDTSMREPIEIFSDDENNSNVPEKRHSSVGDERKCISRADNHTLEISAVDGKLNFNDSCDSPQVKYSSNSDNDKMDSSTSIKDVLSDSELFSSDCSSSESSLSQFDPDGKLALQILENLKTKEIKKDKRKNIEIDNESYLESHLTKDSKKRRKVKTKSKQKSMKNENIMEKKIIKIKQAYPSPPYVSITATDVQAERFEDILGEYKHSTVRFLPSVHQNSIDNSGIFKSECTSANITVEEDSSTLYEEDMLNTDVIDTNMILADKTESEKNVFNETECDLSPKDVIDEYEEDLLSETDESNNYLMYVVRNNCIVVLKHPTELHFHGKLIVQALGGSVEVSGYSLTNKECPIVAPVYSYAQSFKTIENTNDYSNLYDKLTKAGLSLAEAKEIVTDIDVNDGILLLKPYRCPQMEFVANNFSGVHLFKYGNKHMSLEKISNVLSCCFYSKPPKRLVENPSWNTVMDIDTSLPFKGLACGGKGSGKSTFLRYYVNKLLKKGPVLVVDLDPGQSEFTVAGHVSATVVDAPIFGPSFTHLRTPKRALNIGLISTMDNINRYINAVKSIIAYSEEHFRHLPWVINTMGMTNALGLEIITLVIILTQPNFVLQYDSNNPKKRFSAHLSPYNVLDLYRRFRYNRLFRNVLCHNLEYQFIMAPEVEGIMKSKSLAPRDERYLNFLAYFGGLTVNIKPTGWLLEIVPYEVSLKDLYIAVNTPFKDCITKIINGKVVGLCQHNLSTQCKERVFTLSDHPLLCYGHGLIRGIDWEKQTLYVITPLSVSKLCDINTLLYADWVPDLKGQEAHLPIGTEVPYRMIAQQQQMEFMTPPRRRFNPLQLLKMTRNS